MKKGIILKIWAVIALLFIGNRIFNHVDAWIGISLMAFGAILALYFIFKPSNNTGDNEKD